MPAVTIRDVLKAAKTKWLAGPLAGRPFMTEHPVPGRGPPEFILVTVAENVGAQQRTTDGRLWQAFDLNVEYETEEVPTDLREADIRGIFGGTAANPSAGLTLPAGKAVTRTFARGGGLKSQGRTEDGKDVWRLVFRFDVRTEATEP